MRTQIYLVMKMPGGCAAFCFSIDDGILNGGDKGIFCQITASRMGLCF
ncbi:hypothetical protein WKC53_15660 [Morganella morganii]